MPFHLSSTPGPIGVFDSGYGGLTILRKLRNKLPEYDYLYLGDNARAPYGSRSFDMVYKYTRQAVIALFQRGCQIIILACNTASAKALRTIQQNDLPLLDPKRRVLGVIRPTVENVGNVTKTRHIGVLATKGTILSHSYDLEIKKLNPDIVVTSEVCPLWATLVENFELESPGTDYFVQKDLEHLLKQDSKIDTLILGCTHYPLLLNTIKKFVPQNIQIMAQGDYVANSLADYLQRHSNIAKLCTKKERCTYLTTEEIENFETSACKFMENEVSAEHIELND